MALALLSVVAATAWADDSIFEATRGLHVHVSTQPLPVKRFAAFESIAAVPATFDPNAEDRVVITCRIQVFKNGEGVRRAKGTFEGYVFVIDTDTGLGENTFLQTGRFKTDSEGLGTFDYEISGALFADGFESGDTQAWSHTRASFTNNKKADNAWISCGTSTDRSLGERRRAPSRSR